MNNKGHQIVIAVLALIIPIIMVIMVVGISSCKKSSSTSSGSSSVTVAKPSSVTATVTSGNILVTWQDNSDNETSFCLYYRAYDATSWTLGTSTIPEDATSYSFPQTELTYGLSGNFQLCLTAYDSTDDVESKASNIVTISW
jgi:hypothetical protein